MSNYSLHVVVNPNCLRVTEQLPSPLKSRSEELPHFNVVVDVQKVKDLIDAGATAIKLRADSTTDTSDYTKLAKGIYDVAKQHNVPLIIHDRVDVAVSSGADGVEVGKGCLDYLSARKIMGSDALIGVSISNKRQALLASKVKTTYQVIGPVYEPLLTVESLQVSPLGTAGARDILETAVGFNPDAQFLLAGGITPENVRRIITQSKILFREADGVVLGFDPTLGHKAMVARIAETKRNMSTMQKGLCAGLADRKLGHEEPELPEAKKLSSKVASVIARIVEKRPTFRCIVPDESKALTKQVSAIIGSTPEYSLEFEEMKHRCENLQQPQSCLISMGTSSTAGYIVALKLYNLKAFPVILEPRIDEASAYRNAAAESLIASGHFSLIKGTVEEIIRLSDMYKGRAEECGKVCQEKIVDIISKECRLLASRENCLVLSTGRAYVLSDGIRTVHVKNGSGLLDTIGSDALGPVLAACLAAEPNDAFVAVLSGLLLFNIASDQATSSINTKGPGTFLLALMDEIWKLSQQSLQGDSSWADKAIYERIE